jgi:Raptor N-terminal CASPase like domain
VGNEDDVPAQLEGIVSKWRQKERLKTTAVALVLCLNIGVDPPDVIKISPCARLECWLDPLSMQPQKALETIGDDHLGCTTSVGHEGRRIESALCRCRGLEAWLLWNWEASAGAVRAVEQERVVPYWAERHGCRGTGKNLQAQYERWQPRAKYKMHLDPTMDDVKKLAISCRRTAKVREPRGSARRACGRPVPSIVRACSRRLDRPWDTNASVLLLLPERAGAVPLQRPRCPAANSQRRGLGLQQAVHAVHPDVDL